MDKVKCPHCNEMTRTANFCTKCGGKLVETCNCWVLEKPYNCGQAKCPALKLFTDPKLKPSLHQPTIDKKSV